MKRFFIYLFALVIFTQVDVSRAQDAPGDSTQPEQAEEQVSTTKKKKGFFEMLMFWKSDKPKPVKAEPKVTIKTGTSNSSTSQLNYSELDEEGLNYYFIEYAKSGKIDQMTQLLKYGANVNATNTQGRTALIEVSRLGNYKVAKWLIDRGASVNFKDMYDGNALIYATQNGKSNIVTLLLQNGARKEINP